MSLALAAGAVMAVASLAYVLYPLVGGRRTRNVGAPLFPSRPAPTRVSRPVTDEEIEAAVRAYRATRPAGGAGLMCPACGPRPEVDAAYCSSCGRPVSQSGAGL